MCTLYAFLACANDNWELSLVLPDGRAERPPMNGARNMKRTNAAERIENHDEIERAPESTTRRSPRVTDRATSKTHDEQAAGIAAAFLSDGCGPNYL